MSTTAQQPATTPIPVQLSEPEFSAFILPHLSMPKRGPKCKLGYHRVFNLILWLLYTGMQWGFVNLLRLKFSSNAQIVYPGPSQPLSSPLRARDFGPALESFPHLLAVRG